MAHLVIKQDGKTVFFELTKPVVVIGRAKDCDIQITNTRASRKHCRIEECDKGYKIVDLKSSNGTLVNNTITDTKILEAGDTIEIGATVIIFELERKDILKIRRLSRTRFRKYTSKRRLKSHRRKGLKLPTKLSDEKSETNTVNEQTELLNEETSEFDAETDKQALLSESETMHPISAAATKAELVINIRRLINMLLEQFQEEGVIELEQIFAEYWDESIVGSFVQPLVEDRDLMEHLLEISQAINSELHLNALLDKILDHTIEFTNAERGFLILFDDKGKPKVELARNIDREAISKPDEKFSNMIVETVRKTGKPLLSTNAQQEERFQESISIAEMGLRSVLCAPLKIKDETIGVLYIDNRFETSVFSERDLLWLETIADQASVAINNARLYEENLKKAEKLEKTLDQLKSSHKKIKELNALLEKKLELQEEELVSVKETLKKQRSELKTKYSYSNIIGDSPAMQKLFAMLDKITDTDVTVLIQGESGTGKELVARALHFNSQRKDGPFIAENCAAIPENLFESIFFGHTKGAFTGAVKDKPGLFELANGGTLFLDEIGDLPLEMQKKFLRVLQEGEIRRVGDSKVRKVNVRVITATNQNLRELAARKLFREDLLFRLNIITITLPPLRERREDIPKLAEHFLKKIAEKQKTMPKKLSAEALNALMSYDWAGNIRELENVIEQAVTMSGDENVITLEYISDEVLKNRKEKITFDTKLTLKEAVKAATEQVEREMIERVLNECKWKKVDAAERLGISRPTLDSKIEAYKLKPPPKR